MTDKILCIFCAGKNEPFGILIFLLFFFTNYSQKYISHKNKISRIIARSRKLNRLNSRKLNFD